MVQEVIHLPKEAPVRPFHVRRVTYELPEVSDPSPTLPGAVAVLAPSRSVSALGEPAELDELAVSAPAQAAEAAQPIPAAEAIPAAPSPGSIAVSRRELRQAEGRTWTSWLGAAASGHAGHSMGRALHAASPLTSRLDETPFILTMHHRGLPGRRAIIDHVVVTPSGIVVIDVTDIGRLTVRVRRTFRDGERREDLVVGLRRQNQLLTGLDARVDGVRAVLQAGGQAGVAVIPVLCMMGTPWLEEAHFTIGATQVLGPRGLAELLAVSGPLDAHRRTSLHRLLDAQLPRVTSEHLTA